MPWYGYALVIGIPSLLVLGVVLYFVLRKKPAVPPKDSWDAGHDAVGKVVKAGDAREEERKGAAEEHRKDIRDAAEAAEKGKKTLVGEDVEDVAKWIDRQ